MAKLPPIPPEWDDQSAVTPLETPPPSPDNGSGGILDGWQAPDWSEANSGLGLLLHPQTIAQIDFGGGQRGPAQAQAAGHDNSDSAVFMTLPRVPLSSAIFDAKANAQADSAAAPGAGAAPPATGLTDLGSAALTRFEGDSTRQDNIRGMDPRTRIYPDTGNRPTFGIGHLMTDQDNQTWAPNLRNMTLNQQQQLAQDTFRADVDRHRSSARDYVGHEVFDALAPNQQDALTIAEFNGGRRGALGPNMRQHIRDGDFDSVQNDFDAWHESVNGAPTVNPGLVRRQLETRAIWNGDYNYRASRDDVRRVMERGGY